MSRIYYVFFSCGTLLLAIAPILAQSKEKGPIITDFGEVFKIENPDFKLDTSKEYKAVFDVIESPESHGAINPAMETAARFLNMHAQAGVPHDQLQVALVVHGRASKDILSNGAYNQRYGTDNPNLKLIQAILDAGGQVIMCGQSAAGRGIPREAFIPGVQLSLSAMTALIQLQDENYRLIKF